VRVRQVCNSGLTDTVMTVFELREGESTESEGDPFPSLSFSVDVIVQRSSLLVSSPLMSSEFHNLDGQVLLKALRELEKQGKCQVRRHRLRGGCLVNALLY
jgi:hypothetical protein